MAYQREQRLWSDSMTRSLTSIMTSLEDVSQRAIDQTTYRTLPGSKVPLEEWPWEHLGHGGVPATQGMLAKVEPLDVSVSSCGPRCRCRCHVGRKRGQFRVAPFQSVLGSVSIIFFGWTLMGPRCSVLSCQKARVKFLQVTYSTPFKPLGMSVVVSAGLMTASPVSE
ncbi:uncharacterized protein BDV14DRAFT_167203 [Aspergillus stella-maris]|uniref:uncharacterized protein n=1 Tax=Aspergillus stella-maris TaxID=1810926 RepID=UPI003CCD3722